MKWKKASDSRWTPRGSVPARSRAVAVFPAPGAPVTIRTGSAAGACASYASRSSFTSQRSTEARVPGVSEASIWSKTWLAAFSFSSSSK